MILTLKIKILVIATAVILVAIAAVTISSAYQSSLDYEDALQSRSEAIAQGLTIQMERLLQLGLDVDDIVGFEEQCHEVVRSYPGIDAALVAVPNGNIVFQSGQVLTRLEGELLQAVQKGVEGVVVQTVGSGVWHNAVMPAYNPNKQYVASIVVAFSDQFVSDKITQTLWVDMGVGLCVLFTGLALLYISLSKYVTRPLTQLLSTVVMLRQTPLDLTRRATVQTADELGQLGTAFNQLMDELQHTTVSKVELEVAMDEQRRLSDALAEQKERVEVTLRSIGDAVVAVDAETLVRYLNPVAEKLCGLTLKQAEGLPLQEVMYFTNSNTNEALPNPFEPAFAMKKAVSNHADSELRSKNGLTIAVDYTASPMHSPDGALSGGVLTLRDVSKERGLAQRLSWEASHDVLTGLVNRREFANRLEAALDRSNKEQCRHVLCFMDLDRFKVVNDSAGHAAGDQLLIMLSSVLAERVRGSDTLARLGGDEFALLLEECPLDQAERVAAELLEVVDNFRFEHKGQLFTLGVSIGLAVVDDRSTAEEVLTMADTACYMAKEQGRNRVCVYHVGNSEAYERRLQVDWVSRIHSALEEGRFTLFYQSFCRLQNNLEEREHIEVLLRMLDENNNIILPSSFLPAAERYGLMPLIDRWVIAKAFSLYHEMTELHDGQLLTCSINLSGSSLNAKGLMKFIEIQAKKYKLPPKSICFEVTETTAINNLNSAIDFIQGCKSLGFLFALDDFGTGVSSFGYLKALPIDFLKIDGSFVKNITSDHVDKAMTDTINRVGHIMGITTIAEYAEDQAAIDVLREIGVDFAQGFGVHKPEPLSSTAA